MSHPRNRSKIRNPFSFSQGFTQPLVSSLLRQSQVSGGLQRVAGGMWDGGGPGREGLARQASRQPHRAEKKAGLQSQDAGTPGSEEFRGPDHCMTQLLPFWLCLSPATDLEQVSPSLSLFPLLL